MGIDAVFTWVDGNDPAFRAEKTKYRDFTPPPPLEKWRRLSTYTGESETRLNPIAASHIEARFRDMQELRYALRSVMTHAPWVDRIHIVTNGQVPAWLDTSHPKIRIVPHDQIFEDPDCLPCFNSNAIELNLHRIPDLSDNFLYFNDDFFLGRPLTPSDFIDATGRHRLFTEPHTPIPQIMEDRALMGHIWAYNHALLDDRLGPPMTERLSFAHSPQLYNRQRLIEMQTLWQDECALTLHHKFRTPFDTAFRILYTYYLAHTSVGPLTTGAVQGVLTPLDPEDYGFVKLGDARTNYLEDLKNVLMRQPRFFCINDEIATGQPDMDDRLRSLLQGMLEQYFPTPAPFEKPRDHAPALPPVHQLPAMPDVAGVNFLKAEAGALTNPVLAARLDWHPTPDAAWDVLDPVGHRYLPPTGALRLNGDEGGELYLKLEMHCPQDAQHPERGFAPSRMLRVPVQMQPGTELPVADLIAAYHDRLARTAPLTALVAPVLDLPAEHGMTRFMQADRRISAGQAGADDLALLDRALLSGVDVFWVCHRRALAHLQLNDQPALFEDVQIAMEAHNPDWRVFLDLAEALVAQDRHDQALTIASAICLFEDTRPDALYVQSLCRHRLQYEDPDFDDLVGPGNIRPRNIRLWTRIVLDSGQDLTRALDRLMQVAQTAPDLPDIHAALLRIQSRLGQMFRARVAVHYLIRDLDDPHALMPLARDERSTGNINGALIVLDALRASFPWFQPAQIAWAETLLGANRATPEVVTILRRAVTASPKPDFWTSYHLLRAELATGETDHALFLLDRLARQGDHLNDLLYILREQTRAGRHQAAQAATDTLRKALPDDPTVLLYWAEQQINQGKKDADIDTALDTARAKGGDGFWIGYQHARLYLLRGDLDPMHDLITSLIQTEEHAWSFHALGAEQKTKGNLPAAFAIFGAIRAAGMDLPTVLMGWADLAITLDETGPETQAALDMAAQTNADPFWTTYHMLRLALKRNEMDRAETLCSRAKKMGKDMEPFTRLIAKWADMNLETRTRLLALCETA